MKKADFYATGYYSGLASEPRFKKVLAVFRKLKGSRLLDIGCGDGSFTVLLQEALGATEASGIEIAAEAIPAIEAKGIRAYPLDVDEAPLPFEDGSFDVVYCGEVIEHLFNPGHLLSEVHRVLEPGGTGVITTPNLAGWPNRLALLLGYQPFPTSVDAESEGTGKLLARGYEGQWGHIRVFTARALRESLQRQHFTVVRIAGCPVSINTVSSGPLSGLLTLTDRALSRIPSLANRVIAVVVKGD